MNLSAGRGVAVREFKLTPGHGFADYLLFVDGKAVGVLEAKPEGHTLSGVEVQAEKYSTGLPAGLNPPVEPLPFLYLSTGAITKFTNLLDPDPRSRRIFQVHQPGDPRRLAGRRYARRLGQERGRLHRRRRHQALVPPRAPAGNAAGGAGVPLPQPVAGRHQPGALAVPEPAPRAGPDGDGLGEDDHGRHRRLPADQVRRRAARAVPGRPLEPRRAGREGVPGLPHARRQPEVHRAVQRPAAHLEHHRRVGQGRHHDRPAPLLDAEGRARPRPRGGGGVAVRVRRGGDEGAAARGLQPRLPARSTST